MGPHVSPKNRPRVLMLADAAKPQIQQRLAEHGEVGERVGSTDSCRAGAENWAREGLA